MSASGPRGWHSFLIAALPLLAIDAVTMPRGLPAGDSGELIAAAATWGVAHPPGYPLYVMLAGGWMRLLPIGNPAFRLDLFSCVAMSAAAGVLALAVARLTGRRSAGVLAAWAFGLCGPAWKYALVAEVFALNALLASLVLLALAHAERGSARAPGIALAGLTALALSHHQTLVLLAVPASIAVLPRAWRECAGARIRLVRDAGLATLAGLLPLAWLPFASRRLDAQVWGEAQTWRGFWALLLRADYGTFRLDPESSAMHADRSHALLWLGSLPHDLGWLALALAVAGAVACTHRRRLGLALAGFAALQVLFFTRVGFPSGSPLLRGVVERFYVMPALALALLAGLGLAWILERTPRRAAAGVGVAAALLVGVLGAAAHARTVEQRGNVLPETLGKGMLASLPPHAVLFVRGDVLHNALAYLTRAEHRRPDVTVVDQELLTYAWYVRRLRARDPSLLPASFARAERITLRDGRRLEGLVIPRADGTCDVLAMDLQATLPADSIAAVTPAPAESLYAGASAIRRSGWLADVSEDRYSGLPGSRNLLWFDSLADRRSIALLSPKDASYTLRYSATPVGFVSWVRPRGQEPGVAEQAEATLAVLDSVPLDPWFREYEPRSFERVERAPLAAVAARAALVLCQPGAAAALAAHPQGAANLRAFAIRYESLAPPPDPSVLRAIGFLRVFDPGFRDAGAAAADLERWLASGAPAAAHDDEARRTLELLRSGARP